MPVLAGGTLKARTLKADPMASPQPSHPIIRTVLWISVIVALVALLAVGASLLIPTAVDPPPVRGPQSPPRRR
jgi:hypothetical protein